MSTRWSLFLLAGLTGCEMHYRGPGPGLRPVVVVDPGPRLVVVVGTDLRYCEECDDDVFFYSDSWYAYRSGGWYRCASWGAPWVVVEVGRLPAVFIEVPPARFKHRYGPRHPAHDHHPARDRWTSDATPERGSGNRRESAAPPDGASGRDRRDDPASGSTRDDALAREPGDDRRPVARGSDEQVKDDVKAKVKEKKDKAEPEKVKRGSKTRKRAVSSR